MASRSSNNGMTRITNNKSQSFLFSVTMDTLKSKIKIHAKHKLKSHEQYEIEYTEDNLKKLNFYQSMKGFYNRLKMAIESKSPDELRAYYDIQSNALRIILEEISKFDDDSTKWTLLLKKKKIEKTITTTPKLTDTQSGNDEAMQKINYVVKQVKEKFNNEKEERLKLEERIEALETLCTKLTKKLIKVTNELKKEKEKNTEHTQHSLSDDMFGLHVKYLHIIDNNQSYW